MINQKILTFAVSNELRYYDHFIWHERDKEDMEWRTGKKNPN